MPVPKHQRGNYERTEETLWTVRGLTECLDILRHECPTPDPLSQDAMAQDTIFRLLHEKIKEIEPLRAMEWVGIGGETNSLTDEQIALARGEQAPQPDPTEAG